MLTKVSKFENQFSDNYHPNFVESLVKRFENFRADVMASMIINQKGTLVDLACGDGKFLFRFGTNRSKLVGIDISSKRVGNARKLLGNTKHVKLFIHDLDKSLPLRSSSIDTAVCEASIGCLVDPEKFLLEVKRVLKSDGEFIVQIGNFAFLPRRIKLLLGGMPKISAFKGFGDGGMLHYFTYSSLKQLLESQGFVVTDVNNSGLLASWRRIWRPLLAPDIIYRAVKK